jgi:hypothetical protein
MNMSPGAPKSGSEPVWTSRAAAVLAVAVALGVVAPLAVAATGSRGSPPNRVAIIVEGLPPGVSAQITVAKTGQAPQAAKIGRHATITLPGAGTYRVSASPVKVPGGTYFAQAPALSAAAHNGSTATAIVNYADFISASTKVLTVPAGDTVLLTDPPHATGEKLVLEGDKALRGIQQGDFVASGPAPGEPAGYVVKVRSQEPAPPGEVAYDVTPATPQEVFEKAKIDVRPKPLEISSLPPVTDKIPCGADASAELSIDVHDFERSFSFRMEWNHQGQRHWWKRKRQFRLATLRVHLGEHLAGTLASSAHASCDLLSLHKSIAKWNLPLVVVPLPLLHFFIIRPVVEVVVSGHIKISHHVALRFDQQAAATLAVTCARGASCTKDEDHSRFISHRTRLLPEQKEPGAKITGEVEVTPTLRLHLWGLAGPDAGVGGLITLEVSPTSKLLLLRGCIVGKAGFEIPSLGIRFEKSNLLSWCP